MVNVLVVLNGSLAMGGAETYLANSIEHICMNGINVDILNISKSTSLEMSARLTTDGCQLYDLQFSDTEINKIRFGVRLYRFLKSHNYDIVHVNSGRISIQVTSLLAARLSGTKIRIAHSHSTGSEAGIFKESIRTILRKVITQNATMLVACSRNAAIWTFGKNAADNTIIAKNGIDAKKFAFSKNVRNTYRQKLGWEDCFVVGHVGRFAEEKNHNFLIKIFKRVVELDASARLLLVGEGPLEHEIRILVDQYGLTDKVLFAGVTNHVEYYLCAMDVFVLPSLYEGFGIVNIEAQASGLPCIVSNVVPREAHLSGQMEFLPLESGEYFWADKILQYLPDKYHAEREESWRKVVDAGYDICDTAPILQYLYKNGGNS